MVYLQVRYCEPEQHKHTLEMQDNGSSSEKRPAATIMIDDLHALDKGDEEMPRAKAC